MKKKIVIFGINNYTDIFFDYLSCEEEYEVCAYTVNKEYLTVETWNGKRVIPFEHLEEEYPPETCEVLLAIGYNHMNEGREKKFFECKEKGYQVLTYIHPSAIVLTEKIGEGNLIMAGSIIEHGCKLGDGNIINPNVLISHNTELGNFNFVAGASSLAGNIHVGNNCMLGLNCTIRDNVTIGNYTLVGAGTYIDHSTEENSVYVPAKAVKLENKISQDIVI